MERDRGLSNRIERRGHVRRDLEVTFWLLTDDGTSLLLKSRNISASGAFLRFGDHAVLGRWAVGTQVRFSITSTAEMIPDDTKLAEVVRQTADGIAIRFLDT